MTTKDGCAIFAYFVIFFCFSHRDINTENAKTAAACRCGPVLNGERI